MSLVDARPGVPIRNFGGNIAFTPNCFYAPRTEDEVLELLDRHSSGKVRAVGSLHSWSDVAECADVLLDLRHLDRVEIASDLDGQVTVTAGGGCTIQRLLQVLHEKTDATLPTLGAIKKQTIAGAISTATHGSGRPSLSHYMDEVRVAAYNPNSGQARIYCWDGGEELRAARCSLGCLGIILSVRFRCVPKYHVEEAIARRETVEEVIAEQGQYPLQQFVLAPYSWQYFAYQRRVATPRPSPWRALDVYWTRAAKLLAVDFSLHLILRLVVLLASAKSGTSRFIGWFYRALLPRSMERKRRVIDSSEATITLRHDLFRHLELEVYVPSDRLAEAVRFVQPVVSVFAGFSDSIPREVAGQLNSIGKLEELTSLQGSYTHHYPIFFRHVLRDDTLISMTSGDQDSYFSISFFTYLGPGSREHFYQFARFIALCFTQLFQARLHWGKYFPLTFDEVRHQYPQLSEFRRLCNRVDPKGVFQNDYARRVLGFNSVPDPGHNGE